MRHNVSVLFAVCVGYGFSTGLVDFAVPYYLDSLGLSFAQIGTIFAASAVVIFLLRLHLARLSDLVGRKALYVGSLALTSLSTLAFPFVRGLWGLAGLRTGADLSFSVRETMHATALYESRAHGYLNLQGKTRGVEMFFTALGTLAAGYLLLVGFPAAFAVAFAVLAATTLAFAAWFAEPAELAGDRSRDGLLQLLTAALPREIRVLALSGFIFGIAISASHRYIPPLFFKEKFGLGKQVVGQIQLVHILSHVLPLLLVGWLVKRRLRTVFFWTLLVESVLLGLAGCFRGLGPTLFFWWTHDILGAGLWAPIQWALIQRYARRDSRGLDASVVPAATALGYIPGPLLAGWLAELTRVPLTGLAIPPPVAVSLPIIASGGIMIVSALPLLWLPPDDLTGTKA
jgi:MFS family permease